LGPVRKIYRGQFSSTIVNLIKYRTPEGKLSSRLEDHSNEVRKWLVKATVYSYLWVNQNIVVWPLTGTKKIEILLSSAQTI
jgi:hypothetical protein